GAMNARPGAIEAAGRGTLFLDEIAELPVGSQAKLLTAIEEREYQRLGSTTTHAVRARVILATDRDLKGMGAPGGIPGDLFFRVSAVRMLMPALRERREDIPGIAEWLLGSLRQGSSRAVSAFSEDARAAIARHDWPGNVRELRNAIEHALTVGEGDRIEL